MYVECTYTHELSCVAWRRASASSHLLVGTKRACLQLQRAPCRRECSLSLSLSLSLSHARALSLGEPAGLCLARSWNGRGGTTRKRERLAAMVGFLRGSISLPNRFTPLMLCSTLPHVRPHTRARTAPFPRGLTRACTHSHSRELTGVLLLLEDAASIQQVNGL